MLSRRQQSPSCDWMEQAAKWKIHKGQSLWRSRSLVQQVVAVDSQNEGRLGGCPVSTRGRDHGIDAVLSASDTQIVDVRWAFEYRKHHLRGSKRCPILPGLASFEKRLNNLGLSPSAPTVVICEHAVRSPLGVKKLRDMGFTDVRHLRGGMSKWSKVPGVPLER